MKHALCCACMAFVLTPLMLRAEGQAPRNEAEANEAAAAASCMAFCECEEIYRRTDYDQDGVLEYAKALSMRASQAPKADPKALPVPSAAEKEQIAAAIKKFGSEEFSVRDQASKDIFALEAKPLAQLKEALKTEKDPETLNRCKLLIASIERKLAPTTPIDGSLFERSQGAGDLGLIDKKFAQAECRAGEDASKCTPKNGYLFRVLHKQGAAATGGKRDYVVAGNMTLGYALLAFPKEYGVTGKRVFVINNNGTIFEKDCGDKASTEKFTSSCDEFNPDKTWSASDRP